VATHDYVIANGTGAAVRSDINGALAAIVSQNSNASEPATMYAYQWWADTTTGLLKIRNAANSAWVTIGTLASANLGLLPLAGGTMTGVLAVTAGTAALPGIAVSGDTNTGIYSPGADQVAISTGGTGRVFVDANGRVGASNSSPGSYNASADDFVVGSSGDTGLTIVSGTSSQGSIFFADGTTGGAQQAAGYLYYLHSNDSMTLGTSNSPRITILSGGNVGIGTTSPAAGFGTGVVSLDVVGPIFARGPIAANQTNAGVFQYTGNDTTIRSYGATSGSGAIAFNTGGGGGSADTERARIDSSGRHLVGTSSWSSRATSVLQGNSTDGATGPGYLTVSRGLAPGSLGAGNAIGVIDFTANNAGSFGQIICEGDGAAGTGDYPGRLVFLTTADGAPSPTPRMQIGSTGQSLFFTASTSSSVITRNGAAAGTSVAFLIGAYSATGLSDGTNSFIVWTNGNVVNTNNSYGAISDLKLKENIVDANSQWDDLKALQVRNYNFKEGQTHTQIGLVAQEAELVSPGLVTESPDRDEEGNDLGTVTKSINYSVLYMKAVKALQEAMERIEALETRLSALEAA